MKVRRVIAAVACASLACTSPGSFHVVFTWTGGVEPAAFKSETLYMFGQVTAPVDGGTKVVSEAGPQTYAPGAQLQFANVPNGSGLVVTAEIRDAPGPSAQVLAYGISESFSLVAGKTANVAVKVEMQQVLQLPPMDGGMPASEAAMQLVTNYSPNESAQDVAMLRLIAPKRTASITLSNLPDLAAGPGTMSFSTLVPDTAFPTPSGYIAYLQSWDLTSGLPACTQDPCPTTIYASFTDANGFSSATASVDVILNKLTPTLVKPTVAPTAPIAAGPQQPQIVVAATPSEPLWVVPDGGMGDAGPGPAITPHVYNAITPSGEVPNYLTLDRGSDYTFTHVVASGEPNAEYKATFDLLDEAGNVGHVYEDAGVAWTVITSEPDDYLANPSFTLIDGTCTDAGFADQKCPILYSAEPGFNDFSFSFMVHGWNGLQPQSVVAALGMLQLDCSSTLDAGLGFCGLCTCDDDTCPYDSVGDCDDDTNCAPSSDAGNCSVCTCGDGTCPSDVFGDCDGGNCLPSIAYGCSGTIEAEGFDGGPNAPVNMGYPGTGSLFAALSVFDLAGNGKTGDFDVVTQYDAPKVAFASVGYEPGSANPVFTPNAATTGTIIDVTLRPDEEITLTPPPTMSAALPDGGTLAFTLQTKSTVIDADTGGATEVSFKSAPVPTVQVDGGVNTPLKPKVSWSDLVGNSTTKAGWATPTIQLKTTVPDPPPTTTPGLIVYSRTPWGSDDAGPLATYTVTGGAGAAPGAGTLLVYDGTGQDKSQLGRGSVSPNGSFNATLSRADHAQVFVAAVDGAGNVSETVPVHDIVWTGTYGYKVQGQTVANPHVLETTQDFAVTEVASDGGAEDAGTTDGGGGTVYSGTLTQDPTFASEAATSGYALIAPDATDSDAGVGLAVAAATLWEQRAPTNGLEPSGRQFTALAYDVARGVTVLFGGFDSSGDALHDTWEWNGHQWNEAMPEGTLPATRSSHALAYDAADGVTVLFGGYGANGPEQDTWVWDGVSWTQVNISVSKGVVSINASVPPPRSLHAMAYDLERSNTVLFGGNSGTETLQDTWLWSGTQWQQVAQAGGSVLTPPARELSAMVFDSRRGVTVMFGGCRAENPTSFACTQAVSDTWEWNGTAWSQPTLPASAPTPTARYGHVLAYDATRGVTVLYGGCASGQPSGICENPLDDVWEWNGTSWLQRNPTPVPSERVAAAGAYDIARGDTVLFGGCAVSLPTTQTACLVSDFDTWTWNGALWADVTVQPLGPSDTPTGRWGHTLAYDSIDRQMVMHGGFTGAYTDLGDTWLWDGASWSQVSSAGPTPRDSAGMAFDSVNHESVLFGGCGNTTVNMQDAYYCPSILDDTWEWNGTVWTKVSVSGTSPPALTGHAMVFDARHGAVVMFGGCQAYAPDEPGAAAYDCELPDGGSALSNQTWLWDTATRTWTKEIVEPSPPARFGHMMAYDSARERTVLYGGCSDGTPSSGCENNAAYLADTWEWNGSVWTLVSQSGPPPAAEAAMAYDDKLGVVEMTGGVALVDVPDAGPTPEYVDDTWGWNGQVWVRSTATQTVPAARGWLATAYDSVRNVNVLFGGVNSGATQADTWEASSNPSIRPAEIASFDLAVLGATNPVYQSMSLAAIAGGTGNTVFIPDGGAIPSGGSPVLGATMAVWDVATGGWTAVATNTSGVSDPTPLQHQTTPSEVAGYIFAGDQSINLALFPTAGRGNGTTPGKIDVSYIQVIIAYTQ